MSSSASRGGRLGERYPHLRLRDSRLLERERGEQLVAADVRDLVAVHAPDPPVLQQPQPVQRPGVVDAALQHHVDVGAALQVEDHLAIVEHDDLDPAVLRQLPEQELLLLPDQGMEEADPHWPQSSSVSGASPSSGGSTSRTSSSVPQSGHSISSPTTASVVSSTSGPAHRTFRHLPAPPAPWNRPRPGPRPTAPARALDHSFPKARAL